MSDTINEIRGLLEEIYGFKATSKVEQDNLNAALDLLDEVQPRLKLLAESVLESHMECEHCPYKGRHTPHCIPNKDEGQCCQCKACKLAREIVK